MELDKQEPPPEELIDLETRVIDLREVHPVESHFLELFPDNPQARSLHISMAVGLAARGSRIAYVTRQPVGWLYGEDSMQDYYRFMRSVQKSAPSSAEGEADDDHTQDWRKFYGGLRAFYPEFSDSLFDSFLDDLLELQRRFLEDPKNLFESEITKLRTLANQARTVSEIQFYEASTITLGGELILPENTDVRTVREFSDDYYWAHGGGFTALPEGIRGEFTHFGLLVRDLHRKSIVKTES
jgi:hypothetical protein